MRYRKFAAGSSWAALNCLRELMDRGKALAKLDSRVLVHSDLLRIYSDRVEVSLFKGKTDQHCKGAFVTIGRIGGSSCAVHL
jgi:hypothetical protein